MVGGHLTLISAITIGEDRTIEINVAHGVSRAGEVDKYL